MVVLAALLTTSSARADDRVQKLGTLEFEPISEMSGIARSRRFDDVYWIHNDSGDSARLFAIDSERNVLFPSFLEGAYFTETVEPARSVGRDTASKWRPI